MRLISTTAILTLCALLAWFSISTPHATDNSIAVEINSHYVMIEDAGSAIGYGSGTVIDREGAKVVLTAKHVIDTLTGTGSGVVAVRYADDDMGGAKTTWPLTLTATDEATDLAILTPTSPIGLPAATIDATVSVNTGDRLHYVSNPHGRYGLYDAGLCHSTHVCYRDHNCYGVGGLGWYGSSGAGVYKAVNGKPVLVGVYVAIMWRDGKAPGIVETQESITNLLRSK